MRIVAFIIKDVEVSEPLRQKEQASPFPRIHIDTSVSQLPSGEDDPN
jgi:hypothetical protein